MKHYPLITLLLLTFFGCTPSQDSNPTDVLNDSNAALPEDQIIWPLPTPAELGPKVFSIQVNFHDQQTLSERDEGNWTNFKYLVTYKVTKSNPAFSDEYLKFVARDSWPKPGSGIRVKRLPWPFVKSTKTFYLEPDRQRNGRQFFKILSYTK